MIFCPDCDIALADGTLQCPMCQRGLRFNWRRTLVRAVWSLFSCSWARCYGARGGLRPHTARTIL